MIRLDRFSTRFQEFIVLYYFSAACLILLSPGPFSLTDLKSIQEPLADGFSYKHRAQPPAPTHPAAELSHSATVRAPGLYFQAHS